MRDRWRCIARSYTRKSRFVNSVPTNRSFYLFSAKIRDLSLITALLLFTDIERLGVDNEVFKEQLVRIGVLFDA